MKNIFFTKLRLLIGARKAGCCKQYQWRIITAKSIDDLIHTYKSGLRFCLANDYPDKEFIVRHFTKDELHRHGIYIDEQIDTTQAAKRRTIVALGYSEGLIEYNDWCEHRVAVTHTAEVNINARGHTFIIVYIYGKAKVNIHLEDHASVVAYFYDRAAKPVISRASESRATFKVIHRETQSK